MNDELRNRQATPDETWRLPIVPPEGIGVITASCADRESLIAVPARVGVGLRVGGEASLCLACGPGGGVYHPSALLDDEGRSLAADKGLVRTVMTRIQAQANKLPFTTGYDPKDLTPQVMAAYEQEMRRQMGLHEA